MCGICGYIDSAGISREILERMTSMLEHRGPDSNGVEIIGNTGLGHTRLSILDLSANGHQPMYSADRTYCISYNGEFYNFAEYREQLVKQGVRFRSHSDTEVILHLYEKEGIDFLAHIRGMFAMAIWDGRRNELVLARDRVGIKPLYYFHDSGRFAFASEIKSLLAHPAVSREIDREALELYFRLGYIPDDLSVFQGIRKLKPGHTLVFRNNEVSIRRFWDLPKPEAVNAGWDSNEAANHLSQLLEESVRLRLVADVPVGVFLSGGTDSSLIATLATEQASDKLKTFSIGFTEQRYNELPYAREVAQHIGSEHHEFVVSMDHMDTVAELAWYFDEPFADPSLLPTYLVSRQARQHVKVVLSGDGGDELFGGYNWYSWVLSQQRLQSTPTAIRRFVSAMARALPWRFKGKHFLSTLELGEFDTFLERTAVCYGDQINYILKDSGSKYIDETYREFFEMAGSDTLARMSRTDFFWYLPEDILTKIDRASMAVSLEARVPILDHKVCEFAFQLDSSHKIAGTERKSILRKVARDRLPSGFDFNRKQGFVIPLDEWMRGELGNRLEAMLGSAETRDIINVEGVRSLLKRHRDRRHDHSKQLWSTFMFCQWSEKFLGRGT